MAVLLITASTFSQTTLDLPIKTTYRGKPAILISENQMDSINIAYLKLKLLRSQNSSLEMQIQVCKNTIEKLTIENTSFRSAVYKLTEANSNEIEKYKLLQKQKDLEVSYYKSLKSPKLIDYLIGFVAGALVTTACFVLL